MREHSTYRMLRKKWAFTLIELIAATAMFSIIVAALSSVFYSTLRMREGNYERFEKSLPRAYILDVIRRDIANAVPPVGLLAGPMIGEQVQEGERRLDTIEFHTASGAITNDEPWGDIQQVAYYLEETESADGYDLIRAYKRNLLEIVEEDREETILLSGVDSLTFEYFDGDMWRDEWDSTVEGDTLPLAIAVQIDMSVSDESGEDQYPIHTMIAISAESVAEEGARQGGGAQDTSGQPEGGGGGGGSR